MTRRAYSGNQMVLSHRMGVVSCARVSAFILCCETANLLYMNGSPMQNISVEIVAECCV